MRTVTGACHHDCPDSCGWVVTIEDTVDGERATKMRGNPDHPFSLGELCPKVNRYLDRVYSPDRVLTPLRRVGAKGEGRFEPITWDEALAEISQRWSAIVGEHGAEAIMPLWDAGNQSVLAMHAHERFMDRLGASRMVDSVCGLTAGVGTASTYGSGRGADPMEIRHAKCIVLWGTNTRLTNRHLWPFIEEAKANGASVICIDPLRTITADSADWFLQPLPGTDVALMLALLHVFVRDGHVDQDYVDQYSAGFDDLAVEASKWPPSRAAEICGLTVEDVERLAATLASAPPVHFRTVIGAEHREHGAQFFRLLAALPVVLGSWRHRGGGMSRSVGTFTSDAIGSLAPNLRRRGASRSLSQNLVGRWLNDADLAPCVHALLIWNFNPVVTLPNAEAIRAGMKRDDLFTVVHEVFLTDTARYADIVLPAATHIESDDITPSWGSMHLNWNHAAIAPVGESVSNPELFRRLAAAMGYTEPELFASDDELFTAALSSGHAFAEGITVERLRAEGTARLNLPDDFRPYAHGGFATPDGRAVLSSTLMEQAGHGLVVTYTPSVEGPHGAAAAEFPLSLMTPKVHTRFLNSSYAHLPNHGGREGGPYVELSQVDASSRGIATGDVVRVFNHRASLELPARIGTTVRPGVVAVPFGWGSADHADGKTANALTNDTPTSYGGGVAYSDTMVEVARV
jgi:anaerobic selenocysteine-containing dehydrogenase